MWETFGDRVLNIAHRGARSLAPENTLSAARKALETGADMWELDVCMTRDSELVVIHDATLDRTSNVKDVFPYRKPWRVSDFTWEEVSSLDFGSWFMKEDPFGQIASGVLTEAEACSYAEEPAPSLREALAFTLEQKWYVNVEIKDLSGTPGHDCIVEKVTDLIEDLGMVGRVHISSFNLGYLERVKARNSRISVGVLRSRRHRDPRSLLDRCGTRVFHPKMDAVSRQDLARLRDEGIRVLVWVVNDEATMGDLLNVPVDGIFTDFPQTLGRLQKEILEKGFSAQP